MSSTHTNTVLAAAITILLGACGGASSSSDAAPSPSPSSTTTPSPSAPAPDPGYPLVDATQKCDSMTELTLEKLTPKLPAAGPHAYVLTYADGHTTPVTLTFGARGEARCHPGGFSGAVPINTTVSVPVAVSIASDDGVLIGSLDGGVTFAGSTLGSGDPEVIRQTFGAAAELSRLSGTWTPMLNEQGYEGHSVALNEEAPTDQTFTGKSTAALSISEINFMRSPYGQVGAPIGIMRAK